MVSLTMRRKQNTKLTLKQNILSNTDDCCVEYFVKMYIKKLQETSSINSHVLYRFLYHIFILTTNISPPLNVFILQKLLVAKYLFLFTFVNNLTSEYRIINVAYNRNDIYQGCNQGYDNFTLNGTQTIIRFNYVILFCKNYWLKFFLRNRMVELIKNYLHFCSKAIS